MISGKPVAGDIVVHVELSVAHWAQLAIAVGVPAARPDGSYNDDPIAARMPRLTDGKMVCVLFSSVKPTNVLPPEVARDLRQLLDLPPPEVVELQPWKKFRARVRPAAPAKSPGDAPFIARVHAVRGLRMGQPRAGDVITVELEVEEPAP